MNFEAPRKNVACHALSTLQAVRLSEFLFSRALYLKEQPPDASSLSETPDGLAIEAPQRLSFDTFFNSFYAGHWSDRTGLADLHLALRSSGAARLDIFGVGASGAASLLVSRSLDGQSAQHVVSVPFEPGAQGRIYFELTSLSPAFVLHDAAWATQDEPKRDCTLNVVICTYNKTDFVTRNVAALLKASLELPALSGIVVVDQGTQKVRDDAAFKQLRPSAYHTQLQVIEQPNFGGAGGFTRGIMEFLKGDASHVVLMDDDAVIDPCVLQRLTALLNFSEGDFVVGGEMLDLLKPSSLYCHAEVFDTDYAVTQRLRPFDADLTLSSTLDALSVTQPKAGDHQASNYNAWFLCCFPRGVFATCGLPLPMFVRGDDCEFGTRLSAAGIEIMRLPGFCAWHEPFYAKLRPSMEYYSYRNLLITACMQTQTPRPKWVNHYYGAFMYYIHSYQYDFALALCLAIEHFLEGPAFVFDDPRQRHKGVVAELIQIGAPTHDRRSEEPSDISSTCKVHPLVPDGFGWLTSTIWTLWPRKPATADANRKVLLESDLYWRNVYGYRSLALLNPHSGSITELVQDTALARKLCLRMFPLLFKMRWRLQQVHDAYRAHATDYTSLEFWHRYLGTPEIDEAEERREAARPTQRAASFVL